MGCNFTDNYITRKASRQPVAAHRTVILSQEAFRDVIGSLCPYSAAATISHILFHTEAHHLINLDSSDIG